ncbi:MAG: ABC transporter substrate-binding protein [Candidatus Magnetoovum sp. WYHC-5]|nr:ABC transporter substrate-binding protein [Candidatus Magnetoovum sp. WYHC-5]
MHLKKLCPSWLLFLSLTLIITSACKNHTQRLTDHIYYRLESNPTTLDPSYIVDVSGGSIAAKLFNGLVRLDEDLQIVPDIAKQWVVDDSGLIYRFYLEEDVYFHNGKKLTAADFEYSFKRILSPNGISPNTWVLRNIDGAEEYLSGKTNAVTGIKILDEYTIEIKLVKPFSPFLKLLTMPAAYVVPNNNISNDKDFSTHPVGTGPFKLKQWSHSSTLTLEKNAHYFAHKNLPKVNGIVYKIIPEDLTAVMEFLIGNLDVLEVPVSSFALFMKDKTYSQLINISNGINTYYLGLNNEKPPFNNPALRKAVYYAIDRQKILDTYYQRRGRLADGPVPEILKGYKLDNDNYNPAKAKEIIKDIAAGNTIKAVFYVMAKQESIDIAEIISDYLSKVGIHITIQPLEWSAFKTTINNATADMFWLSWWADYPDEDNFLYPMFHSSNFGAGGNRSRYKNVYVDMLIDKARTVTNEYEKTTLLKKAESIIIEEVPCVFFWHRNDYIVHQPWIKKHRVFPVYNIDKGNYIELET